MFCLFAFRMACCSQTESTGQRSGALDVANGTHLLPVVKVGETSDIK